METSRAAVKSNAQNCRGEIMNYDWLPASDGQFVIWFNHFRQACEEYSGSLDLSAEDLMEIENDYRAFAYSLDQIQALRGELQNRIDFKNAMRDGPEQTATIPFPAGI